MAFTFLWLFSFQTDLQAYAQHFYSGGQTHYNGLVGALLLTFVLWMVQLVVYAFIRLHNSFHALTYFPSFAALAALGAVCPTASGDLSFGFWWLVLLLLTALWLFCVWAARGMTKFERRRPFSFFSRSMWVNLLILAVMMVVVAFS